MPLKKQILPALCFVVLLGSCAKPLISNLEKGTYKYQTTTDDVLDVAVSSLPITSANESPEKPKTFFDLRDSLPHLFLKILANKVNSPDTLIRYLSKPLSEVSKKTEAKKQTDYTLYKIRFSFSSLKKYYNDPKYMHPNTRLEYLTTTLHIPANSSMSFYNIDKLENEYDEIDLGTLSRDQTVTLNAKISGELGSSNTAIATANDKNTTTSNTGGGNKKTVYDEKGNVTGTVDNTGTFTSSTESNMGNSVTTGASAKANGELGYLNNETIKEAIAVKLKRLRTGFNFSPTELTIAQRGRPLGDISDNIYVTSTIKISSPANIFSLDVYDFDKLFAQNGEISKADDISFASRNVSFVPCDNAVDITLAVDYEGAIRAPQNEDKNAGENALEYDDKVTFYKFGKNAGKPLIFDKNLYCKNAYKVTANLKDSAFVLKIAAPVPKELDIFFDDHPEVFLQWVLGQLENPVAANLISSKFMLYFENIVSKTRISLVNRTLSAPELTTLKKITDVKAVKRLP